MHAGLVLSAHVHNKFNIMNRYRSNNASGMCLAASYPQPGMQSPIKSECKVPISTSGAERESQWFLADVTRSPIYNQAAFLLSIFFSIHTKVDL